MEAILILTVMALGIALSKLHKKVQVMEQDLDHDLGQIHGRFDNAQEWATDVKMFHNELVGGMVSAGIMDKNEEFRKFATKENHESLKKRVERINWNQDHSLDHVILELKSEMRELSKRVDS